MDQFGQIRRHHWKERLKISKIAKFESDTHEDTAPQSCENLQTLPTLQTNVTNITNVRKISRQITFKLGDFINFKALFSVVSTDFPELVHVKSWKKTVKRSIHFVPFTACEDNCRDGASNGVKFNIFCLFYF